MTQGYFKSLQEFLEDDPGLKEKITYDEYAEKRLSPENTDDKLEDAYAGYRAFVEKQGKRMSVGRF